MKLLVTALVIGVIYVAGRIHGGRRGPEEDAPPPGPLFPEISKRVHTTLYAVAAALVLSAGWIIYDGWKEDQREVRIRVVNVESGKSIIYKARVADVHSRTFRTLDGLDVNLADVERMEIETFNSVRSDP